MKRYLSVLLCIVMLLATLSACTKTVEKVRITSVHNSPAAALAHMFSENGDENPYAPSTVNLANRVRNLIADGECDVAVIPVETAALIYRRGLTDIKVLAGISTSGFELISTEKITDFSELKGKKVYLTERGTIMESIFKYLISQYGIDPFEEIDFDYVSDAKQLEAKLANDAISFALMSSADAASAKATVEGLTTLNLKDGLTAKIKNPSIVTYCIIATTDFINNNPSKVEQLLKDAEASVLKAANLSDTVSAAKKAKLLTSDIYNEDFLSACKIEFISGKAMKSKLTAYFKLLLKVNSSLIGKNTIDDNFYYITEK